MTRHYPEIWRALQPLTRLEKYASESPESASQLARTCAEVFDLFLEKAAGEYSSDGTPAGAALLAATFAEELYDTKRALGEKVASEDAVDLALEQLATVAYVDAALKTAADGMSGEEYAQTQHLRLLGREYGVELLKNLVG